MKRVRSLFFLSVVLTGASWSLPAYTSPNAGWDQFDPYIQQKVLSYISGDDLIQLGQTSQSVRQLAHRAAQKLIFRPKNKQTITIDDLLFVVEGRPLRSLFSGISLRGFRLIRERKSSGALQRAATCYPFIKPYFTASEERDDEFSIILQALASSATLTYVDLSYNRLTNQDAKILSQTITLKELKLEGNWISDEGALALSAIKTLGRLNLECNYIGRACIAALKNVSSSLYLNVYYQLTDDGSVLAWPDLKAIGKKN